MKKPLKQLTITLLTLLAFLMIVVAVGVGVRAYAQHRNARAMEIKTANGISEAMYVKIGRIDQWVQILGPVQSVRAALSRGGLTDRPPPVLR